MIVGESLFGVLNAGLIVGFNRDAPLAIFGSNGMALPAALVGFGALLVLLYGWMLSKVRSA